MQQCDNKQRQGDASWDTTHFFLPDRIHGNGKSGDPGVYTMFKLDIDKTPIEMSNIDFLLRWPSAARYIQEFYFEHHVHLQHMLPHWGEDLKRDGVSGTKFKERIGYSYLIFLQLRLKGIRAHGWP